MILVCVSLSSGITDEGFGTIIENVLLIMYLQRGNSRNLRNSKFGIIFQIARTSVYPKGSSPLLLACHSNNVDVVQLLLDFKAKRLEMPLLDGSSLGECRYRLDLVKALACPAYIVLTSQDPVMQAFEVSQLCRRLKVRHFKQFTPKFTKHLTL